MIDITPDPQQLSAILEALDELSKDDWIARALKSKIQTFGQINKKQMDLVAQLPYSPKYIGKLKPSKLRRAGGENDLGFGRDRLNLLSDVLFNWEVDGASLTNYSDLAHAIGVRQIAVDKGQDFYADDGAYLDVMESAIGDAAEEVWGE